MSGHPDENEDDDSNQEGHRHDSCQHRVLVWTRVRFTKPRIEMMAIQIFSVAAGARCSYQYALLALLQVAPGGDRLR